MPLPASPSIPIRVSKIAFQLQQFTEQNHPDFSALVRRLFSLLHADLAFDSGWFATPDPASAPGMPKINPWFYEVWRNEALLPKRRRIALGHDVLLPDIGQLSRRTNPVSRGREWWTEEQLTTHPFYQTMLRPASLYSALLCLLMDDRKVCRGYLVLWRVKTAADFSEEDIAFLTTLAPTLANLFQKGAARLERSPGLESIDREGLQLLVRRRTPPGAMLLNERGKLLYISGNAKRILRSLSAETASGGDAAVPQVILTLWSRLKRLIDGTKEIDQEAIAEVNHLCIGAEETYLIRALRLSPCRATGKEPVLILIERVSRQTRVNPVFSDAKLTPREQEVVRLLIDGKTNREVGLAINAGEHTVKAHIKGIMAKLQVGTRAAIVSKALRSSASSPAQHTSTGVSTATSERSQNNRLLANPPLLSCRTK